MDQPEIVRGRRVHFPQRPERERGRFSRGGARGRRGIRRKAQQVKLGGGASPAGHGGPPAEPLRGGGRGAENDLQQGSPPGHPGFPPPPPPSPPPAGAPLP